MDRDPQKLDQLRSGRSELENHVIDEFVLGRISRREFLRRGSIIGLSIPALGAIVSRLRRRQLEFRRHLRRRRRRRAQAPAPT